MNVLARVTPRRAARLFAVANIAFLGVDIGLAHRANEFGRPIEWGPVVFSAVATVMLLPGALGSRHRLVPRLDLLTGSGAIVLGVAGMLLHLESGFFASQTLHNLVYSAPFVAPLSYVGVGLLVVLLRSEESRGPALGPWILLLALGGFAGNLALSLLDHAQNGFFHPTEWIPVSSAAFAIGFLAVALARPSAMPRGLCLAVMGVQAAVGVTGFVLHLLADLQRTAAPFVDRFVFGAPPFAPLLFCDLALLATIGLFLAPETGATEGRMPEQRAEGAVTSPS